MTPLTHPDRDASTAALDKLRGSTQMQYKTVGANKRFRAVPLKDWLGNLDSNQDRRSQSPLFYH